MSADGRLRRDSVSDVIKRALFIRLDKIGDVTLTLPVDTGLAAAGVEVTWLLHQRVRFLIEQGLPERKAEFLEPEFNWAHFKSFMQIVKRVDPQVAIFFWGPWWIAWALWLRRVRLRVGRYSQWYSFLFFNRGVRQSRSLSEKHESQYGMELRKLVWPELESGITPLTFRKSLRRQLFDRWQLRPQDYVVVHPGMAGSALNWPRFQELVGALIARKENVVITGTPGDKVWTEPLRQAFEKHPQVRWTVSQLEVEDLIFILQNAKAVVAPSTGVAHLAASCGVKLIGLYSPVLSQHPNRWRPLGPHVTILMPEVPCPAKIRCHGLECEFYLCMKKIEVERVLRELAALT